MDSAAGPSCAALRTAERNAQAKIAERTAWMHAKRRDQAHLFKSMSAKTFQSALLMAPYYPCLWTLNKSPSVQKRFDGGKWLCGVNELATGGTNPCVVYSLGSNYDTTFEDHFSGATRGECEFFIFDPTMEATRSHEALVDTAPRVDLARRIA